MGPCASALGVPQMPKPPEFPAADVAAKIAEAVLKLPEEAEKVESQLRSDWEAAKLENKDLLSKLGKSKKEIKIVQTYDETKDKVSQFKKFAYLVAAAGEMCEAAADQIWEAIKPELDKAKPDPMPAIPGMDPDAIWDKVLSPLKKKVSELVRSAFEKAADEAIAKMEA